MRVTKGGKLDYISIVEDKEHKGEKDERELC